MNSEKLNDWLQILGAAGIIASLIFVGLQLKQSQDIAIAAQYQARHDSASENIRTYLQSETTLRFLGESAVREAQSNPNVPAAVRNRMSELPPEVVATGIFQARLDLMTFDNLYFQYQSGFLSEESWQASLSQFRYLFRQNSPKQRIRRLYEFDPMHFRQSLRDLLDDMIAEIDSEQQRTDQR